MAKTKKIKTDFAKEWFKHEYQARNNMKFKPLILEMGYEGLGLYWCIVEILYEVGGYIQKSQYKSIAYDLHTDEKTLSKVLHDFDLFESNSEQVFSDKVIDNLKKRITKRKKAQKAAKAKHEKFLQMQATQSANADQTPSERRENKKEEEELQSKNKNIMVARIPAPSRSIEERFEDFRQELVPFVATYGKDTIREFFDYWTEKNKSGKKMRFEMQRTFETSKRLTTWNKKSQEFKFNGRSKNLVTAGKLQ